MNVYKRIILSYLLLLGTLGYMVNLGSSVNREMSRKENQKHNELTR